MSGSGGSSQSGSGDPSETKGGADRARAVILLSGGLDSAANLALCAEDPGCEPVLALTADYGQRASARELRAARELCEHYGVRHATLDLRWLGALGGSALTEKAPENSPEHATEKTTARGGDALDAPFAPGASTVPDVAPHLLDDARTTQASARAVWVPNRNGVLINAAAAYAERMQATRVIVGFNREEAATFPDNSAEFLARASRSLAYSTANQVEVHCYTTALDKREIVARLRGLERAFPFTQVWSCYHGGDRACGACESCRRLARALG